MKEHGGDARMRRGRFSLRMLSVPAPLQTSSRRSQLTARAAQPAGAPAPLICPGSAGQMYSSQIRESRGRQGGIYVCLVSDVAGYGETVLSPAPHPRVSEMNCTAT